MLINWTNDGENFLCFTLFKFVFSLFLMKITKLGVFIKLGNDEINNDTNVGDERDDADNYDINNDDSDNNDEDYKDIESIR